MVDKPRVLFVHSGLETFVCLDLELLSGFSFVQDFHASRRFPHGVLLYWREIYRSDIIYCWFAGWNSFWALLIARMLGKPSVLVVGGYDVACLPEAKYGHQRGGINKLISNWAMCLAMVILPFSRYSQKEARENAGVPDARMTMLYIGVPDPFFEFYSGPREKMALTVGNVDWSNLKRKGLEPFVRAASDLPDVQFVVVGNWKDDSIDYLRTIATSNVCFTGRVSDNILLDYYQCASVYVQASLHEGFGLSVAEAMLAGCIPVVTKMGSLPEVVGDCGIYTVSPDPKDIAIAIQKALDFPSALRTAARERILNNFPLEKREKLLELAIMNIKDTRYHAE